jgi:uncharacterized protein (DUF934 family)
MRFIHTPQDPWRTVHGDDGPMVTITPKPNLLLTWLQWHSVCHHWPAGMPVGAILENDQDIRDVAADLPRLGLIALRFPKWVDGRAYSQAHLLRSRYRFQGEIRALGEVLVDMLPLLQRTGFDAVVLRADQSREAAERALTFFPGFYQGDTQEHRPHFARPANEPPDGANSYLNAGASI